MHFNVKNRELIFFQLVIDEYNEKEIIFVPILVLLPSYRNSQYELMITYEDEGGNINNNTIGATCHVICEKSNEVEYILRSDFSIDEMFADNKWGASRNEIRDYALQCYPELMWPITYMDILPTTPFIYSFRPPVKVEKQSKPYWLHIKLQCNNGDKCLDSKWGLVIARNYFFK